MVVDLARDKTEVGNYFVANYPPFSFWKREHLPAFEQVLMRRPQNPPELGLYLHIPFCRKRCKFCYFRVYTDVGAPAIQHYVEALAQEVALVADKPAVAGRIIENAYFGGGTPSYLSARQLGQLVDKLRRHVRWDRAKEVTFECEPGTLSEGKLVAIRDIGVTRLSLGVENFDDSILEQNGRAHLSAEIFRAWNWITKIGFPQVNIDLIAGMVGESWQNWRENVRKTIELSPDSVTIYQLELPYNTRFTESLMVRHEPLELASWSTKRAWVSYAYDELQAAGYAISSAYTLVKAAASAGFRYRDALWHGSDLLGMGVASFGHLAGVHYQNVDGIDDYQSMVSAGRLPVGRALPISRDESLIRELVLQMKLGRLEGSYFRDKFGRDVLADFADEFAGLAAEGMLTIAADGATLSRDGLLRVDSLLPRFYRREHQTDRYV
jgi:oxygen-independent coproporphyrinogen-3 oxidase